MKKLDCLFFLLFVIISALAAQPVGSQLTIARLKYSGGGDWYNDPSCIPNLLAFIKQHANINAAKEEVQVGIMDEDFFSWPIIFMTGHGRIAFTGKEVERLRTYLTHGGFLYADDDYGMDEHFKREMNKVFPDKDLMEIPFSHGIFHSPWEFPKGLPKIHEHDGGPPAGLGYFHNGRLVVFYSLATNISDGWADPDVHGDPPDKRELALKMGMNIIVFALMN